MLAMASTKSTASATPPLFWSISSKALEPAAGGCGGASDWRKKARVAARIGVYLNLKASRWGSGLQVGNQVHCAAHALLPRAKSLHSRGMLRSERRIFEVGMASGKL